MLTLSILMRMYLATLMKCVLQGKIIMEHQILIIFLDSGFLLFNSITVK